MSKRESLDVGAHLRAVRQERGLSLRALAKICELSPNTISLIERGITSPSVSTLHRMATALRVPITAFFEERPEKVKAILLRAGEQPRSGSASVLLESLGTGLEDQTLEPFVVTMKPGARSGRQDMVHAGHELVYCLQGEVEYTVDAQPCRLAPGDSLLFQAKTPHSWRNPGHEPAIFLLVFQAAVKGESVEHHLQQ
ncbi:cupin domain-containing protein [Chloroflexota bacterium]